MDGEDLRAALDALNLLLQHDDLEPDAARRDWGDQRALLDNVREQARRAITALDELLPLMGDDSEGARRAVGELTADAAVLLHAAGDSTGSDELLRASTRFVAHLAEPGLTGAAAAHFDEYCQLVRAWWLYRHEQRSESLEIARGLVKRGAAAIAESAKVLVDAPQPTNSPPSLFTLNGFGLTLYGRRDERPDGTYTGTRYLAALFIPLFAIDAWRVMPAESDGWYFLGKVPLGGFAKWWRRGIFAFIAVAIAAGIYGDHVSSPEYRAKAGVAEAEAHEAAGDNAAALMAYEGIASEYGTGGIADGQKAAGALARLLLVQAGDDDQGLVRAAKRVAKLPPPSRAAALAPVAGAIMKRAEALRPKTPEAALALLGGIPGQPSSAALTLKRGIQTTLAERDAKDWPLDALRAYAEIGAYKEAVVAADALVPRLGEGPSVWLELTDELAGLRRSAKTLGLQPPGLGAAAAKLRSAQKYAAGRGDASKLDLPALQAALAKTPGDQEVAVALSRRLREQGKAEAALKLIEGLGPRGLLVRAASLELASLFADLNRLAEADDLLDRQLRTRLPRFEAARRAYDKAATAKQKALVAKARFDRGLGALMAGVTDEGKQQAIFQKWLGEQLDKDQSLERLRAAYTRHSDVVALALTAGQVKLRRANATSGEARKKLLDAAERAFLSIQAEASGAASFHLGLGQVYHRLGKTAEGDAELQKVLDQKDPQLAMAVARAYRDLGVMERARAISKQTYEAGKQPAAGQGAILLALMSRDRDEQREWYAKAPQADPFVRTNLLQLDAEDLFEQGKFAAAERKFGEVAKTFEADATHNASAANNAALAHRRRYACTGDVKHIDRALKLLEDAVRQSPDAALLVSNLAASVEYRLHLDLLEPILPVSGLRLDGSQASSLVGSVFGGPARAKTQDRLRRHPKLRRLLDLSRQEQTLAPSRTDAYHRELRWLGRVDDLKATKAVLTRLQRVKAINNTDAKARLERWVSGAEDAKLVGLLQQAVDAAKALLDRAPARGKAAAQLLYAESIIQLAELKASLEHWKSASVECTKVGLQALNPAACERNALVGAALHRARQSAPALDAKWKADGRRLGVSAFVAKYMKDQEVVAALRSSPELAAAAVAAIGAVQGRPGRTGWVLGQVSGDQALQEATRGATTREPRLTSLKADALLAAYTPKWEIWLSLKE